LTGNEGSPDDAAVAACYTATAAAAASTLGM
jgi:hypothetical protein